MNEGVGKIMKRKWTVILLLITLLTAFSYTPVEAADRNVTNIYKQKTTKILRGFDSYLGYCCGKNQYFKYDAYARTTMVYLKKYKNICGKSTAYAKKKMIPQMKLYFNTSTVKLKKYTNYKYPANPSFLIQNRKGKLTYVGGNWGECVPRGVVKKIIQKDSTYEITYDIYLYDTYLKKYVKHYRKNSSLMGTYKIIMKRCKNQNGFIIKNIKQTYSAKMLV